MFRRVFSAAGMQHLVLSLAIPFVILAAGLTLTGCGLTGDSGGGTRAMTVTPSAAGFGNVTVKTDATQTIKVSNTGTGELKVFSAEIAGAGFSLSGLTVPTKLAALKHEFQRGIHADGGRSGERDCLDQNQRE